MLNLQYIILAGILGGPVVTILFYRRSGKDNEGANTVDRLTEQITNLTSAQAEISAQITRLISAQAENSARRGVPGDPKVPGMERLDEVTDDLRSQQRDAGETV